MWMSLVVHQISALSNGQQRNVIQKALLGMPSKSTTETWELLLFPKNHSQRNADEYMRKIYIRANVAIKLREPFIH